jgi:hypothetical protein
MERVCEGLLSGYQMFAGDDEGFSGKPLRGASL